MPTNLSKNELATILSALDGQPRNPANRDKALAALERRAAALGLTTDEILEAAPGLLDGRLNPADWLAEITDTGKAKVETITAEVVAEVICGGRCDPVGLDAGIEGSTALVCDTCCREHAPAVWQGINAGRRFAEAEAESAATVARLDAEAERKPRPLPAPSAMARALHLESRTIGEEAAEWTPREDIACNIVLAVEHIEGEALQAFNNLIEGGLSMNYSEARRIVSERYRRRIEGPGDTFEDLACSPWSMASELISADWAPPGFTCSDEEAAALAHVLAHERMAVCGSEFAADRLGCGEKLAASEAVVESFYRRIFRPDEQPIAVEDLKWSREGEPLPWQRGKADPDARPYWS